MICFEVLLVNNKQNNINPFANANSQFIKATKLSPKMSLLHLNAGHCWHHANQPLKAIGGKLCTEGGGMKD